MSGGIEGFDSDKMEEVIDNINEVKLMSKKREELLGKIDIPDDPYYDNLNLVNIRNKLIEISENAGILKEELEATVQALEQAEEYNMQIGDTISLEAGLNYFGDVYGEGDSGTVGSQVGEGNYIITGAAIMIDGKVVDFLRRYWCRYKRSHISIC